MLCCSAFNVYQHCSPPPIKSQWLELAMHLYQQFTTGKYTDFTATEISATSILTNILKNLVTTGSVAIEKFNIQPIIYLHQKIISRTKLITTENRLPLLTSYLALQLALSKKGKVTGEKLLADLFTTREALEKLTTTFKNNPNNKNFFNLLIELCHTISGSFTTLIDDVKTALDQHTSNRENKNSQSVEYEQLKELFNYITKLELALEKQIQWLNSLPKKSQDISETTPFQHLKNSHKTIQELQKTINNRLDDLSKQISAKLLSSDMKQSAKNKETSAKKTPNVTPKQKDTGPNNHNKIDTKETQVDKDKPSNKKQASIPSLEFEDPDNEEGFTVVTSKKAKQKAKYTNDNHTKKNIKPTPTTRNNNKKQSKTNLAITPIQKEMPTESKPSNLANKKKQVSQQSAINIDTKEKNEPKPAVKSPTLFQPKPHRPADHSTLLEDKNNPSKTALRKSVTAPSFTPTANQNSQHNSNFHHPQNGYFFQDPFGNVFFQPVEEMSAMYPTYPTTFKKFN